MILGWENTNLRYFTLFLIFYTASFNIVGKEISTPKVQCVENKTFCQSDDLDCIKIQYDLAIKNPSNVLLNYTLSLVYGVKNHDDWKNNALGVLYMLKRNDDSLEESEKYLLMAYKNDYMASSQNLAELYFLKNDYKKSIYYLKIIDSYNHKFPSTRYINWARLYAQHLYLSRAIQQDKEQAIRLFNKIKKYDHSGASHYFLGYHELELGNRKKSLALLNSSAILGNTDAQMRLGDLYMMDKQVAKNIDLARPYYIQAAKKDNNRAYYNLAMIARQTNDIPTMKKYLTLAAKFGNKKAIDLYHKIKG